MTTSDIAGSQTLGPIKGATLALHSVATSRRAWSEYDFVLAAARGDVFALRRHPLKAAIRVAGDDEEEVPEPTLQLSVIVAAREAITEAVSSGKLTLAEADLLLAMVEWQQMARETAEHVKTLSAFLDEPGAKKGSAA